MSTTPAFKEWAIICDTLGAGEQSIILRKGGIAEEQSGFAFQHKAFALFPTLYHEQIEQTRLPTHTPMPSWEAGQIPVRYFAQIDFTRLIKSLEVASALEPFHVWRPEVITQRFQYDDGGSLHLAMVRIYRYQPAFSVIESPAFAGCRSWVTLDLPEPPPALQPVIDDEEHARRREAILAFVDG